MAVNYIQPGDTITAIAPTGGMVSGTFYKMGTGRVVVALGTGAQTTEVECAWQGVYEGPKEAPLVISYGDTLYWDDSAKKLTKTESTNVIVGECAKSALSADTTVWVRLK